MIRWVYYSLRNLCYYRQARPIPGPMRRSLRDRLFQASRQGNYADVRYALTSIYLSHVGLRIADTPEQVTNIPLSPLQREWADKVAAYGFSVSLL